MAANPSELKPQTMSPIGILARAAILLTIILISVLVGALDYLAGNVIFFVALFPFILFGFNKAQGRNLLLLACVHLLVMMSVINVAVVAPPIRQIVTTNLRLINADLGVILFSILIGLVAAVFLVTVPFFILVIVVSGFIFRRHKREGVSFTQFFFVVLRFLGVNFYSLDVDEETKHEIRKKLRLELIREIKALSLIGVPFVLPVASGVVAISKRYKGEEISLAYAAYKLIHSIAMASDKEDKKDNTISKVNPYIAGDPINNPELFFGRDELIAKILQGIPGNHIAIQGPRRSGKTSLLVQITQRLKNSDSSEFYFVPVLFDCHETTETAFFYDLMDVLLITLRDLDPSLSLPLLIYQAQDLPYNNRHFKKDIEVILTAMKDLSSKKIRIVLLLDEGDALNEYDRVTQRKIRNLISQHRSIKMIWAGTDILAATGDPTSPWYNMQLTYDLSPLLEAEARELITRPVANLGYTYQPEAIQRILGRAEGQPYIIQYLCYRAVESMLAEQRSSITLADVETAIIQLEAEKSAQDPSSVVYQSQKQAEVDLTLAEEPAPYRPEEEGE